MDAHDLYSSPNITRVIKSGGMRWAEHMIRGGEGKCIQGFCWEPERDHRQDPGADGRKI